MSSMLAALTAGDASLLAMVAVVLSVMCLTQLLMICMLFRPPAFFDCEVGGAPEEWREAEQDLPAEYRGSLRKDDLNS